MATSHESTTSDSAVPTPKSEVPSIADEKSSNNPQGGGQQNGTDDETPLSLFLSTFKAARTQWVARQVIIMISLLFRLGVGLGPYSGFSDPPMHGDFEAQRHWMEITYHLPMKEWYWYDLQYWGLDYPPLTAYHSWVMGAIGSRIKSSWFALDTSRGCEDINLKSYMRNTVIISELLIYIPAVSMFVRWTIKNQKLSPLYHSIASAAILLQPALILIDHGHFQYNAVMLGLSLLAITNILMDKLVVGSVFFVLSLCFKQMALYYSIPIFAYLLGICIFPRLNLPRFISLALSVLVTFALVFAPIILTSAGGPKGPYDQVVQILIRIFPFARGLWEDKVANIWCTLNTFVKLKVLYSSDTLQRLSLVTTFVSVLPAFILLFLYPRKKALIWGVSASAWAFFLFSFQVHEKSVLLPLLPVTLQLAGDPGVNAQSYIYWINNVAVFSLWPLLKRDGLVLQYFVISFLANWLMASFKKLPDSLLGKVTIILSYAGIVGLHAMEFLIEPPSQYPDLWVLGNITLSFGCFAIFLLWNYVQLYRACMQSPPNDGVRT
ncbi:glycosyl transferase [Lipomyces tetrasporus]|uniref:Alpha-1,3-glucosyltransferase n=1 Tax=Lipomyces tetrasporus TaxID=54092 RepID=A0AAD7QSJ8_9ASCO|nr:glycosyl transferase [Lipomyces tetrasporus]KAJ8100605.1 glycosyl transferase [Lipomyces tetrasporus]